MAVLSMLPGWKP